MLEGDLARADKFFPEGSRCESELHVRISEISQWMTVDDVKDSHQGERDNRMASTGRGAQLMARKRR